MSLTRYICLVCFSLLVANAGKAADKQPIPALAEQQKGRMKAESVFKTDYAKKSTENRLALADKLIQAGAEEKDAATKFGFLVEAILVSSRAGDVGRALKAAQELDKEFEAASVRTTFTAALEEAFVTKGQTADYQALAAAELNSPTDASDQGKLATKWLAVGKKIENDYRNAAFRRAYFWNAEALASEMLKGLERVETEKNCQEAIRLINTADAKNGKYTLYAGKWVVKYDNKFSKEMAVAEDGRLVVLSWFNDDGKPIERRDDSAGKLVRRAQAIVGVFGDGKILERYTLNGNKLSVERYDPPTTYPSKPAAKGEAERQK